MQLYLRSAPLYSLLLLRATASSKSFAPHHRVKYLAFVPNNSTHQLRTDFKSTTFTMSKSSFKMVTMDSPSAQRNKGPIWSIMESTILPLLRQNKETKRLRVLEIAGGCGVHTEHFASEMAKMSINAQYYPTDPDDASLQSYQERVGALANTSTTESVTISTPFCVTLGSENSGVLEDGNAKAENNMSSTIISHAGEDPMDLMICINMIHISPWTATMGLFKVASAHLSKGGILMTYGPYKVNGTAVESNLSFDESLKSRNAEWGVRDLESVEGVAKENGLVLDKVVEMPANNLLCIFRK